MPRDDTHLIWLDLEMTGLNPDQDRIIEIATLVTDSHLDPLAEGPVIAVYQPEGSPRGNGRLESAPPWCFRTPGTGAGEHLGRGRG